MDIRGGHKMAYTFTIADKGRYLHVTTDGSVGEYEELYCYSKAVMESATRLGKRRILLEESGLDVNLSPLDAVRIAENMLEIFPDIVGCRISVVHAPHKESMARVFETAFRNRGQNHRSFSDLDEAVDWLNL